MFNRRSAIALCLTLASVSTGSAADTTGFNLSEPYAQTLWPTGHRDQSNTDYVPVLMSQATRVGPRLLAGHPLLWPPAIGPEGNLYVTSGKGSGYSNLHAFNQRGELLWQSPPQESADDVDGLAVINAPVVDVNGTVYVGDGNQLWAFTAGGEVKWVVDLARHGAARGFITPLLTRGGLVGGITSDGKVMLFQRETGELARPVLDLPGGEGPPAEDEPPRSLWRDLMDPDIREYLFNLVQGWEMEVANTPAVHPETDRIYITAQGVEADSGLLYGIDVREDRLDIAFQTPIGKGSGTSPAISHDGERVYAVDENAHLFAVDAADGSRLWTKQRAGSSASPSVGPDETIYSPSKDYLLAFRPDGTRKFRRSYNDLCHREIAPPDGLWQLVLSEPVAFIDSIVTIDANDTGWINVVCGYHVRWLPSDSERTRAPIPVKSLVVAVDAQDGDPLGFPLLIPESSEGFITPVSNGNQFVTLSGALGSIYYHSLNRFLPRRYEVRNEPQAGLLMLQPVDRLSLAQQGIDRLAEHVGRAQAELREEPARAIATLKSTTAQFYSTGATIRDADAGDDDLRTATRHVAEAIFLLEQALPDKAERNLDLARKHLASQHGRLRQLREKHNETR